VIDTKDSTTRLYKREADGELITLASAENALRLTTGNWYEGKVVIDDDPNNTALQRLRFWVDTDGDGDIADAGGVTHGD
jgi:hypothetical protein